MITNETLETYCHGLYAELVIAPEGGPFSGKTKEHWAVIDGRAMMTQLGHVPPPGETESW